MASEPSVPETRVLAIASHVVYGYVGNKMATFVMQCLGCDVSAINTVNYSNHTAYKQVKGTKTSAEQIHDLYEGLKQSNLNNFDVLLSGYMPNAEDVQEVGRIGRDLKFNATTKPGSFFWVLDPVMGDEGKLYIPEDEVPQYKYLLGEADLILPNQFEAELLSDTQITDLTSLAAAIKVLHRTYLVPHVIITSLRLSPENRTISKSASRASSKNPSSRATPSASSSTSPDRSGARTGPRLGDKLAEGEEAEVDTITIIGSTATSDHTPRLFRIDIPAYPLFFSGTGDMFAALTVARLREAVFAAELQHTASWKSPDDVLAPELPLAKATEKVLASMQAVLAKTAAYCDEEMRLFDAEEAREGCGTGEEAGEERAMRRHLRLTRASEVRVARNIADLVSPEHVERFRAGAVDAEGVSRLAGEPKPNELGVVNLGIGGLRHGAVDVMDDGQRG